MYVYVFVYVYVAPKNRDALEPRSQPDPSPLRAIRTVRPVNPKPQGSV